MTTTTRFDEIASRARRSRVRDAAFAVVMAGLIVLGITSVRAATTTDEAGLVQPAAAHTAVAATPTVCDLTVC